MAEGKLTNDWQIYLQLVKNKSCFSDASQVILSETFDWKSLWPEKRWISASFR